MPNYMNYVTCNVVGYKVKETHYLASYKGQMTNFMSLKYYKKGIGFERKGMNFEFSWALHSCELTTIPVVLE